MAKTEEPPAVDSGADITDSDADWSRFLKSRYKKQLALLSREYPYTRSIEIDYRELESFGRTGLRMADQLLDNPGTVIENVRNALKNHQLVKGKDGKATSDVNVRFVNLPRKIGIRQIRSDHINRFISVDGILRKTTEVRPRIVQAVFRCPGGHITVKEQGYGRFKEPEGCGTDGCTFKKLDLIPRRSRFVDSQKLRIQESPEGLRGGEQPQREGCTR